MATVVLPSFEGARLARREVLKLAIGYALIMLAIWTPLFWAALFLLLGLGWVAYQTLSSGTKPRDLGLTVSGVKRDYWVVPASVAIAAFAVFPAIRYNTLHLPFSNTNPELHAGEYLLWAVVQQFILQNFFLARLLRLMSSRSAAVVTAAGLFASAHIPNPLLVVATFLWGLIACALFLHYRDLLSLGVAHAVFGLCLAFAIPAGVHHQMRVGLGYLRYHPEQVEGSEKRCPYSAKRLTAAISMSSSSAAS